MVGHKQRTWKTTDERRETRYVILETRDGRRETRDERREQRDESRDTMDETGDERPEFLNKFCSDIFCLVPLLSHHENPVGADSVLLPKRGIMRILAQ